MDLSLTYVRPNCSRHNTTKYACRSPNLENYELHRKVIKKEKKKKSHFLVLRVRVKKKNPEEKSITRRSLAGLTNDLKAVTPTNGPSLRPSKQFIRGTFVIQAFNVLRSTPPPVFNPFGTYHDMTG